MQDGAVLNDRIRENAKRSRSGFGGGPARAPDIVTAAATFGAIAVGVALFEAALVPGLLIGGAAVLAPRCLPLLSRGLRPLFAASVVRQAEPTTSSPSRLPALVLPIIPAKFAIGQAVAKTITFRVVVTALDFTSNYVVLGEVATAAGLSAFALVAGPLFYLAHEAVWNYYGPAGAEVTLPAFLPGRRRITISRALAKTVTFRIIATAVDFTTLYVVVGDFAVAAGLSAFGFVVDPFVYLGHEMAWDHFTAPASHAAAPPPRLLPAPRPA
jgi:uncharacterized membrane protein